MLSLCWPNRMSIESGSYPIGTSHRHQGAPR